MSSWIHDFPLALLLLLTKSGLVLLVAFLGTLLLKSSPASRRHTVWAVALVSVLALPALSMWPDKVAIQVTTPLTAYATPIGDEAPVPEGATMRGEIDRAPAARARFTSSLPWQALLLILYCLGVAFLMLRLGLGWVRVTRMSSRAAPIGAHRAWWRALLALGDERRLEGRSELLVSDEVRSPVTFGLLRPTILLPSSGSEWSDVERRCALIHEFAHVSRRDHWMQLASTVATALYWFHPLVLFAARRLQLEAERACDERVMGAGTDAADYARQLIMLTRQRCPSRRLSAAIPMASRSELSRRVTTILSYGRNPMRHHRLLTIVAAALTAAGLLTAPIELTSKALAHDDAHAEFERGELTALMAAAASGDVERTRQLIAAGADVNQRRHSRGTPLIHAASSGHLQVVRLLIENGADVNLTESGGRRGDLLRSPLGAAARGGHDEIVRLLLEKGAKVDAAPSGDATALMEAAEHRRRSIVAMLLERGADVGVEIPGDGSPLIAAARGGDLQVVRQLVDAGADVDAGVAGDGNALIAAVRNDDEPMVRYLLSQGADPSAYVSGDETAIVAAAEHGNNRILRLLLELSERGSGRRSQ